MRSKLTALVALSMMATILPAPAVASGATDTLGPPGCARARTSRPGRPRSAPPRATNRSRSSSSSRRRTRRHSRPSCAPNAIPASREFGQYLAPGEFVRRFGPSAHEIAQVTGWLHRAGITDTTVDGLTLRASTSAGAVAHALGVTIERYRTPDRRQSYSALEAPLVPAALAGGIASIVGLSDEAAARPHLDLTPAPRPATAATPGAARDPFADGLTPCSAATTRRAAAYYTADQVGSLYGVGGLITHGETGTGRKIALVELAPHSAE